MPSLAGVTISLAVLCSFAQCGSALVGYSTQNSGNGCDEESQLAPVIDRSARAAAEAVLDALAFRLDSLKTETASQLESLQTDLESQIGRLETRLLTRMRRLEAHLDDVTSQLTSQVRNVQTALTEQVTDLSARLQDTQAQVENQMAAGSNSMFSRMVDIQSQMLTAMLSPRDCSDLPESAKSGVYLLWPSPNRPVPGYCDLDTAGGNWTVIQRRTNITPRQNFDLGWEAYGRGFGPLLGEFWWGNENLFRLTAIQGRHYELLVELEDPVGQRRRAAYHTFRVSSVKDGYRLTVAGYSGDAGDALSTAAEQRFSTKDKDQDESEDNCASLWEAGWWYGACPNSNPNGPYVLVFNISSNSLYGVVWPAWQNTTSLVAVEMKIRPTESPAARYAKDP